MTNAYFKQVYYSLHPKLYRVAYAILKNTEDAEDIIQDAYCKLWDDRKKLVDVQKPEAYCVTLVKNLCLDFLSSLKMMHKKDFIDDYDFPDHTSSAETDMVNKEKVEKIKSLIHRLPYKQQRVLDLRVFSACSSSEIEQITGESSENVRVLLSRARNTLKMNFKNIIMIDERKIEQLLTAFYEGITTPEEEEIIHDFFDCEAVSEKWQTDGVIFNALYEPTRIPLPDGFAGRLETSIDNHMRTSAKQHANSIARKLFISILSTAAVILLCLGLFFMPGKKTQTDFIADTYTNPAEAAVVAEKTLLFISSKLNEGLVPLEKVKANVNKTYEILNENL